jgi:hypothetical protein
MAGNRHPARFEGMLILSMASTRDDENPSIVLDQIDYVPNFHWIKPE